MDAPRGQHRALNNGTRSPRHSPARERASGPATRSEPVALASPPPAPAAPRAVSRQRRAHPEDAPDGPPPGNWRPTRLGISYRPRRLAIEYVADGRLFRKLLPVQRRYADDAPADVLSELEREFREFLDFEGKLSRSQTLRLVEMLLASGAEAW